MLVENDRAQELTWKKKFRRVLLAYQGEVPEAFVNIIKDFANDITLVDLNNYFALDLLQLPADCLVLDGRSEDLMGIGMIVGTAQIRALPSLVFCLRSWSPVDVMGLKHPLTSLVLYSDSDYRNKLKEYLEETNPFPFDDFLIHSPWMMKPWTVSISEVLRSQEQSLGNTQ